MAVAIVKGDELVYSRGFGSRVLNGTEPITPDTVFQLGSASKAFTAAVVAKQVDAGRLDWNSRLIDYLPDFRLYDPWVTREFTVTDALSHRSGLPANAGNFLITLGFDGNYAMHAIRNIQPAYSFRSASGYSNILPLWAARLVENVTGKSWEEDVETEIFDQLAMNNSSIGLEAYQSAKNVAAGHWVSWSSNGSRVVALPRD
jgi:CubicO group peptidase (beta-lactamase class C family)